MIILLSVLAVPAFAANSEKSFGGVGIDGVNLPDGQIRVRQIVAGGPAHQSGIRAGDVITHIDGKATRGSNFQQMVQKRLRGISGTQVILKVLREGSGKELTFRLTRRQLVVNPAK